MFGKICVSIFFFLGGYGLYIQSKNNGFSIIKRIKKLYTAYWKVFVIFIPIAFIFFKNQIAYCNDPNIYTKFNDFNFGIIIKNFVGLSSSLNNEWWFFSSYIIALISFPIVKIILDNTKLLVNVLAILIIIIFSILIIPQIGNHFSLNNNYFYYFIFLQPLPFICCFYVGMLFAKYNYIVKLNNLIHRIFKKPILISIIVITFIVYSRYKFIGEEFDIIYVPLLIVALINLIKATPLLNLLEKIGNQSTNMCLIHTFYCYYFYPVVKIVVKLRWAIPCLIVLTIITYISSKLINYFWNVIEIIINKLQKKLAN